MFRELVVKPTTVKSPWQCPVCDRQKVAYEAMGSIEIYVEGEWRPLCIHCEMKYTLRLRLGDALVGHGLN